MKLTLSFVVQILSDRSLLVSRSDLPVTLKGYVPLAHMSVDLPDLISLYLSVGNVWQNLAIYSTCFLLLWMISVQHTALKQPNRRE